jgi:hypothetical protein
MRGEGCSDFRFRIAEFGDGTILPQRTQRESLKIQSSVPRCVLCGFSSPNLKNSGTWASMDSGIWGIETLRK